MDLLIGIHVSQFKRYESGASQPTLEVLKKIVEALNVSADSLLFKEHEREPTENKLKLQFEAISKLPPEQYARFLAKWHTFREKKIKI